LKVWDKRFGGTGEDKLFSILQTSDGGCVIGGYSFSGIGGDKTQLAWGSSDYWIVKIDSMGNKEWDKDFGGFYYDILTSINQTTDHGFIIGGHSSSSISGDKTQGCWGGDDYWIVKTDSLGNKQWDKDFGGDLGDWLSSIQQTADGGYILAGTSESGIAGDKTQATNGGYDYWIVKTDSLGNKEWDKDFGGNGIDVLNSVQQTGDGGYILGGHSMSGINGDKTEVNWGASDYWIVKIDSLGNKLWDKDFGGTEYEVLHSIQQTSDSGFILGGISTSDISGNKSQPTWGGLDYWIVKTDSLGNKLWDKNIGGAGDEDEFGNLTLTSDGGFLIAGTSYSAISGNKSEANLGSEQSWMIKTNSLGNKVWDKTIFTVGHDESGYAIETSDPGCYFIANNTIAGIGGYKTQDTCGANDYWIVKFCETVQAGFTSSPYLCPGVCIDFVNLSFQATSFQWSFPGASPDTSTIFNPTNICYFTPGSFAVQLIATNANGSDTLLLPNYITVFPAPLPQSISQNGDTLFAIAGSATYQWYFNGNMINGATDYLYVAPASGNYNVIVTDNNGCEVEAVINNVIASFQLPVISYQLEIFPNPVEDKFTIHKLEVTRTAFEISIYNMLGEKIILPADRQQSAHADPSSGELTIDCRLLSPGMYSIEIISGENIYRTKFVKQ